MYLLSSAFDLKAIPVAAFTDELSEESPWSFIVPFESAVIVTDPAVDSIDVLEVSPVSLEIIRSLLAVKSAFVSFVVPFDKFNSPAELIELLLESEPISSISFLTVTSPDVDLIELSLITNFWLDIPSPFKATLLPSIDELSSFTSPFSCTSFPVIEELSCI